MSYWSHSVLWEGTTQGCECQEVESLGSYWRLVTTERLLAESHSESLDSIFRWPPGWEGVEGPPCGTVGGTMERHLGGRKGFGPGPPACCLSLGSCPNPKESQASHGTSGLSALHPGARGTVGATVTGVSKPLWTVLSPCWLCD